MSELNDLVEAICNHWDELNDNHLNRVDGVLTLTKELHQELDSYFSGLAENNDEVDTEGVLNDLEDARSQVEDARSQVEDAQYQLDEAHSRLEDAISSAEGLR